jgi:hypothetical protein
MVAHDLLLWINNPADCLFAWAAATPPIAHPNPPLLPSLSPSKSPSLSPVFCADAIHSLSALHAHPPQQRIYLARCVDAAFLESVLAFFWLAILLRGNGRMWNNNKGPLKLSLTTQ